MVSRYLFKRKLKLSKHSFELNLCPRVVVAFSVSTCVLRNGEYQISLEARHILACRTTAPGVAKSARFFTVFSHEGRRRFAILFQSTASFRSTPFVFTLSATRWLQTFHARILLQKYQLHSEKSTIIGTEFKSGLRGHVPPTFGQGDTQNILSP